MQRQQFDPDLQAKFEQIVLHITEKNKVVEQFAKILKQICDWETFNSRNFDKFANSISKLLVGKDPLKDVFILFQRMLASKSDQSMKLAVSIKQDMMPYLQKAIDIKQQNQLKAKQKSIKQMRLNMQKKIRSLYSSEISYKRSYEQVKNNQQTPNMSQQSRQGIQDKTKLKKNLLDTEALLSQSINIFNHTVQDYMLYYTSLCQHFSQIETRRKAIIKESISKYIVFEMDAIKNIQYDISRHAKSLQKMQDKLIIQDKLNQVYDPNVVQLAKISTNNYIMHLTQRDKLEPTGFHKKMNELKKQLQNQTQISKQKYRNLMSMIDKILNETLEMKDMKTLKEIVFYSKNIYMLSSQIRPKIMQKQKESDQPIQGRRIKIYLMKSILCHKIFTNEDFWQKYSNRLNQIVKRQLSSTQQIHSDQMKISLSFLSKDIQFMKELSGIAIVDRILQKYLKYNLGSSEHIINAKSNDSLHSGKSIKSKATTTQKKQIDLQQFKDVEMYF